MRRLVAKPLPAVLLLLGSQAALLAYSAYVHSPTDLEPEQLAAGIGVWRFGRFDLFNVNPPLVRSIAALPVLASDAVIDDAWFDVAQGGAHARVIGDAFVRANGGLESCWYFTLARWACIPLVLSGGVACFLWARELYGAAAGLLALALWCFEPNLLGHGSLITNDVPAASLGLWAGYLFWRWLRCPTWSRAVLAGVALGLAELTKLSWLLLFGLWPALWIFWGIGGALAARRAARTGLVSGETAAGSQQWRSKFAQLLVVLALAVYLINVFYAFNGTGNKLSQFQFVSRALTGRDSPGLPGNRFSASWLGALRVPLPAEYVQGADRQEKDLEHFDQPSFLDGKSKNGGWWYYYLYGLWVKLPHGLQLLILLATESSMLFFVVATATGRSDGRGLIDAEKGRPAKPCHFLNDVEPAFADLIILAPAAALLAAATARTELNQHVRYVWPCLGFLMVFCAKLLHAGRWSRSARGGRWAALFTMICLLWMAASGLRIYPHCLSYFNELAGGPALGSERLSNSNVDWGQGNLVLNRWIDSHSECQRIRLALSGIGLSSAQIADGPPPPGQTQHPAIHIDEARAGPHPGWYAVSVDRLRCRATEEKYSANYEYFTSFKPVATIAHSINVYNLSEDAVNRYRLANGLPKYDQRLAAGEKPEGGSHRIRSRAAHSVRDRAPAVKDLPAILLGDADELTVTFEVANESAAAVTIDRVLPSCNCSSASVDHDELAAGATTTLRVVIDLTRRTGEFSVQTTVIMSDESQRRYIARLAVYPRLVCQPEQISFGVVGPNDERRQEAALLTYARDPRPPIPKARAGAETDQFQVTTADSSVNALRDGIYERSTPMTVVLGLRGDAAPPGPQRSFLAASSGMRDRLEIAVHWSVRSQFEVSPPSVFFSFTDPSSKELKRQVKLRRIDGDRFSIRSVKSSAAAITCDSDRDPAREHELEITLDRDKMNAFAYGTITVETSDLLEPKISLPVAASTFTSAARHRQSGADGLKEPGASP